jgi:hypothetical protein
MTPAGIASKHGLSPLSTERYLTALSKVGLIERGLRGKVRLLVEPPFGFGPDSKVLGQRHEAFLKQTTTRVLQGGENAFALLKPLNLEKKEFREMLRELSTVVDKYSFRSEHRTRCAAGDREDWSLAIAAAPHLPEEMAPIVPLD